jgi:hypothetical protein
MSSSSPPRARALALAVLSPVAIGGILATTAGTPTPVLAAPAIVLGVFAGTSPALYIASAATGAAPPLAHVARAFVTALAAFGIALAGFVLPASFLALSSIAPITPIAVTSAALAAATALALLRLWHELHAERAQARAMLVFVTWAVAAIGIAGRMWLDFAVQVAS